MNLKQIKIIAQINYVMFLNQDPQTSKHNFITLLSNTFVVAEISNMYFLNLIPKMSNKVVIFFFSH